MISAAADEAEKVVGLLATMPRGVSRQRSF